MRPRFTGPGSPASVSVARRGAALLVLGFAVAGCLGPRKLTCEARGGRAWNQHRSAHFDIYSDADARRVATLAGRLERAVAQLAAGMAGDGAVVPPGRVRVVALDDSSVFQGLAGPGVGGYFRPPIGVEPPTIVLPIRYADQIPQIVAHELAHYVSRFFFPRQPLWFGEGLAAYYETLAAGRPGTGGWVGGVNPLLAHGLRREGLIEPRELLTATTYPAAGTHLGKLYTSSWFLYLWLRNERREQLADFERRLEASEPPDAAWRAAFPDLDPADDAAMAGLTRALEGYRDTGFSEAWSVVAAFDPRVERVRHVPAPEVHGLLRGVHRVWSGDTAEARLASWRRDVDEQLAEDPLDPEALTSLALAEKRSGLPELRRAAAARPYDWRAWYSLAGALWQWQDGPPATEARSEAEAALRKALTLAPEEGRVLSGLAWALALDQRSGEALPLARRAVELTPMSPPALHALAVVEADLGHCKEALLAEERAAALRPPSDRPAELLTQLRARCGESATPSGERAPGGTGRGTAGD